MTLCSPRNFQVNRKLPLEFWRGQEDFIYQKLVVAHGAIYTPLGTYCSELGHHKCRWRTFSSLPNGLLSLRSQPILPAQSLIPTDLFPVLVTLLLLLGYIMEPNVAWKKLFIVYIFVPLYNVHRLFRNQIQFLKSKRHTHTSK